MNIKNKNLRREIKDNFAEVINAYSRTVDQTPNCTIIALVDALGYQQARKTIAELVNTVGSWDGRIYTSTRQWAMSIQNAASPEELEDWQIYTPAAIHPSHIQQLAEAMQRYVPACSTAQVIMDEYGVTRCAKCQCELTCDSDSGDMPDHCPKCGAELDYSLFMQKN